MKTEAKGLTATQYPGLFITPGGTVVLQFSEVRGTVVHVEQPCAFGVGLQLSVLPANLVPFHGSITLSS